jgi:hypothetical protein
MNAGHPETEKRVRPLVMNAMFADAMKIRRTKPLTPTLSPWRGEGEEASKKGSIDPKKKPIPRRSSSPLTFCDTFSLRTSHYLTERNPPLKADN